MANVAVLEGLRARLCEVQARHEADGRAAAEAFWSTLGAGADDAGPGATEAPRARRPRLREVAGRAGGGLWAHVPADEPLPFLPREVGSVELSELDLDGADADWFEANYPGPTEPEFAEPVAVKVDALLGRPLVRHGSDLLAHAVGHLSGLRAQQEVMLVNVLAELLDRGETPPGGLRVVDWLRSLDPSLTAGQAKDFVTVAGAVTRPRWAELAARVTMQHVTVAKAARIIEFEQRNERVTDPDDLATAVADLVDRAPELIQEDFTGLVSHHTEQVRPPKDGGRGPAGAGPPRQPRALVRPALEHRDGLAARRCWTRRRPRCSSPRWTRCRCPARARTGGAAPSSRTRGPRPRGARTRCSRWSPRGVAAGDGLPVTDRAKLVVTVEHDVLAGQLRGTGAAMTGDVLSVATVRRLACDAAIIPMVLGTKGEPLDVGRARRLVTKGLRAALWQRDQGCSFPGCTIPAAVDRRAPRAALVGRRQDQPAQHGPALPTTPHPRAPPRADRDGDRDQRHLARIAGPPPDPAAGRRGQQARPPRHASSGRPSQQSDFRGVSQVQNSAWGTRQFDDGTRSTARHPANLHVSELDDLPIAAGVRTVTCTPAFESGANGSATADGAVTRVR